jgi:hypothetical protein
MIYFETSIDTNEQHSIDVLRQSKRNFDGGWPNMRLAIRTRVGDNGVLLPARASREALNWRQIGRDSRSRLADN